MRRWMFVLLLFVMPFQSAWSAAAPYCAHGAGACIGPHFGHHDPQHQADGEISRAAADTDDPENGTHADCDTCHLGCLAFMPVTTAALDALPQGDVLSRPEPRYASHIPALPLRPDQVLGTDAVRFGGDVVVSLAN